MYKIYDLINRLFQHQSLQTEKSISDNFIREIVSGGQTGVDRAALDVAIELKILHGGWCPHGRKSEDGTIATTYKLREAPAPTLEESLKDSDAIFKKRTELNVRDADGTLIILKAAPVSGTLYTITMAEKYNKPCLILDLSTNFKIADIADWIIKNNIRKLNIAGPRASQTIGIYEAAYDVLQDLLNHPLLNNKQDGLTEKRRLRL